MSASGEVPKFFPGVLSGTFGRESPQACGEAVNKSPTAAIVQGLAGQPRSRWLHIAASAADEIAYAGPEGSRATRAWHACIVGDRGRSGRVFSPAATLDGEALRRCAQTVIDSGRGKRQTITLLGDTGIRLR